MTSEEEFGEYGLLNGFGVHGPKNQKTKLVRRAVRAAERGDWEALVRYAAAYGLGVYVGDWLSRSFRTQ